MGKLGQTRGAKLAAILLTGLACSSCQPERPQQEPERITEPLRIASPIPVDKALAYEVIQRDDIGVHGRNRVRAFIYSSAESVEARIQTSMKAAVDLRQSSDSDFVKVFHLIMPDSSQIGTGTYYVDLSYAPDSLGVSGEAPLRNGTWEAMVSDQVVDRLTLEVEKLWWRDRSRFQRADGFGGTETDEKALKKSIARQLKVKPGDVHLAVLTHRQYP